MHSYARRKKAAKGEANRPLHDSLPQKEGQKTAILAPLAAARVALGRAAEAVPKRHRPRFEPEPIFRSVLGQRCRAPLSGQASRQSARRGSSWCQYAFHFDFVNDGKSVSKLVVLTRGPVSEPKREVSKNVLQILIQVPATKGPFPPFRGATVPV